MHQKTMHLVLSTLLCLFLSACGQDDDDTPSSSSSMSTSSSDSTSSKSSSQGSSSSDVVPTRPYTLDRSRHAIRIAEGSDIHFVTKSAVMVEPLNGDFAYISANFDSAPMVSDVVVGDFLSAETAIPIEVHYLSTNAEPRAPGTYFGSIELQICHDASCSINHQEQLEIIYTVVPSQVPQSECADAPGVIFADCADPTWVGPYAWQIDLNNMYHFDYFSNDGSLLVDWSIISEHHSNGETVIDVLYTDDEARGQLNFTSPLYWSKSETMDMRSFAEGTIEFDVFVEDWGLYDQKLQFAVECEWPCSSGRIDIPVTQIGQWQHFSFAVADLVDLGLDLSNVNIGFIIGSLEDTPAEGLHFALDNIQWVGGTEQANRPVTGSLAIANQQTVISTSEFSTSNYVWVLEAYVEGVDDEVFYSLDTQNSDLVADFVPNNDSASDGVQRLFIYPVASNSLWPGSYKEELSLRACADAACEQEYSNSPFEFEVIFSIAPESRAFNNCEGGLGDLFIDCFGQDWQELSSWESKTIGSARRGYRMFNGDGSFGTSWEILDLEDGLHGQVIDITHGPDTDITNYMQIVAAGPAEPTTTIDLSDYQNGKLEMDVRVLDWGQSSAALVMTVECLYPCRSSPRDITPQTLGQWQSFSFPVSDLIESGLDITQVHVGINVAPAQDNMAGAHYQLDNIRWVQ